MKPRKLFRPVKPKENLEPYDYRAVLFTQSYMNRSSLHTRGFKRKLIHFSVFIDKLTDELKMAF